MEKEFLRICKENNVVGATCIVTKNNEIKEVVNYGYSNCEKGIEVSENVVFRIASVSKLLVATCIMQLVEKGKLDLDEDVSKYLGFKLRNPKYPDKVIDLKMIMTQTSSISDGQEAGINSDKDTGYNSLNGNAIDVDIEDMLVPGGKYFVPETFNDYEPGTHFEYSNFGCGILACILERVEKKYFFDYFKENVADRLGIKASFQACDMDVDNIACTYSSLGKLYRSNEKFFEYSVRRRELGNNFVGAAGGLFISLADLNKIMNCYLNDGLNLLKKETMDRMLQLTWYGEKDGDYTAKGLQFQVLDWFEHRRLYGHFGCAYNVRSFLLFNPIQKLGMVCYINGADYKVLDCGITNVQEAMIRAIVDEYWDDSIKYDLTFDFNGKVADLNGRKIQMQYDKDFKSGRHLDMKTLLDIFTISTWQGKAKLDSLLKGKTFLDAINLDWMDHIYNLEVTEKYKDEKFEMKNKKETFHFEYVKKKNLV